FSSRRRHTRCLSDWSSDVCSSDLAYQLRARVRELVRDLPEGHDVRGYAEKQMELLDRLGHASSKAEEGPRVARDRPGWDEIPREIGRASCRGRGLISERGVLTSN